jgi:peptidoglycan/LPS O-acetylase OafA/YrhL
VLAWSAAAAAMVASPYLHPRIGLLATLLVAATFATAILATHGRASRPSGRWARAVTLFSGFSFSLYLIHLPVQHLVATAIGRGSDPFLYLPPHSIAAPAVILALAGASYAAAWMFSLATEAHTAALRRWLSARVPRARVP